MSDDKPGRAVPTGRLSRVGRLGGLAGRIAGNMVSQGASQWLKGQRPKFSDLLLTPANISRIADQLATMRGAAMKVGQLLSMDSGDFLPPELAAILARLRQDAEPMPKSQLTSVLDSAWGVNWQQPLLYFSFAPVAAASIGQVHKVITMEGQTLAVKVQYPGVKKSIDSDVDNVASLIRLSGLVPKELDLFPILSEAKQQLHQEADYVREAQMLTRYRELLGQNKHFVCPEVYAPLSCETVLAMDYLNGDPIESLSDAPQEQKDRLMGALMQLFFREVFDFQLIQSDPNLANYRYQSDKQQIALLDFGATREVPASVAVCYRQLLQAAANRNREQMRQAAIGLGLFSNQHSELQQTLVVDMGMMACESIHASQGYDFGTSDLMLRLHELGHALTFQHNFWHAPPPDALFIHRKLGGLFLLAKKLGARLNMRQLAEPWL
ncbi:AarF/ABC1/UbiB kinase family protein [Alteromonas aestuariivivens]|uniref:AarF/ABC1/UbiB kinase family protein n=1 Tax=Alteromonas aestuariivivens TaxID=1938339 RepID=A0A3D8M5D5_9ALTE|nr:AarF/ABC1/UbiB kinase family protein [Alteromonas aestuariivivens]RDV24818.1 AarF/ABC1/UbiB kinase family protein [Alteromonas aestuariivivens]